MKRIAFVLFIIALASPLLAQAPTTTYQNTLWLDAGSYTWSSDSINSKDTLTVASRIYTLPVQVNGGRVSIECKAIFTGGTDSMKGVLYGSNYPNGFTLPRDTMRLFPLDSFKMLASGSGVGVTARGANFKYVAALEGKFSIWVTLLLAPLNGTTGKVTQVSIGKQ